MRRDFEAAYSAFKKLVVAGSDLRNLEPAFIFCLPADVNGAEQFISSVETDVYFCRKFVIGLSNDIGSSLASLPFMPLAPIGGAALRPTSAQTFLQQSGVPALLAKQLVVPHERSAKGIFDDCLAGKHGEPANLGSDSQKGMHEVAPSDSEVFLERVIIRNVRAYRKEQEFRLGHSITVLYGPNGFGKTSFFDAIDFGITGSIGRLRQRNDAYFRKTVQHLDSHGEDAYVNIVYNRNGERNTISRRVARPMSAQLNGVVAERKRILSALTNTSTQASERVDNYVSLFRATHLFSQEQQELTKNFRADCELSMSVVSRMLAVEDYVNAKAKAGEVRDLLNGAIGKCDEDIAALMHDIATDNQQLEALKAAAAELPSPSVIQAEIAEITARMAREGFSNGDGTPDIAALRKQRALVDGAIGENQAALGRLASLVEPVSELPEMISTLRSVERQIAQKQGELNGKQEQVNLASMEFDASRQAFAVAERGIAQARKAVEDHAWFSASLPVYRDSDRAAREAEETLNRELAALGAAQAEETRINDRIRDLQSEEGPIAELLNMKQAQHSRLEQLLTVLPVQKRKLQRISKIVAEEQRVQGALNRQNEEWTVAQGELASEVARADGLTANIARLSADQQRLVGLLDEVEGHIEDGICPVCGDDHGSRDALIRKIELRRTIDRSADLANLLSESRVSMKRLRDRLDNMDSERSSLAIQLRTLAEERSNLEAELQSNAVRGHEFAVDALSASGEHSARQLLHRMAEETRDLRDRLDGVTRAVSEAQTLRVTAAAAVQDKKAAVASRREAKAAAEALIDRLRADERWNQALATAPAMALQGEAATRGAQLEAATAALSEQRRGRDNTQVELEGLKRQTANVNAEIVRLRTQLANANRRLVTLRASLVSVQLPDDADSAALAAAMDARRSTLGRLQILRDALIKAELALDAATTAASHVALQSAIRDKEARKDTVTAGKRSYQPWLAFFKEVCRRLEAQQAEAIGNFTNQYGPRTSIIQRRLRSVYSFDDIELKEQAASIVVRVRRGTENLRPVDYFSQSQQQTLVLGLFLTACSSQTWSSFSSVFLDDPVTHFDDLNTYSLLDLISGLLNTDSRRRQFIISTCDDKFLQLALRKFRYLGLAARFYRFESIGRGGPVVNEITSGFEEEQPKLTG
jgi:exonuclease SbcC